MTILSSAPRQSEFLPILCTIVHFQLAAGDIDQVLGLAEGETQLLLRGLHSVLNVPSEKSHISSHHASFLDFLHNPDRSGNFCVSTSSRQISLARDLLQFCAGPFQRRYICLLFPLLRFIVSLPPSGAVAELFPLIGSINPEYIFDRSPYQYKRGFDFSSITSWLKKTRSAPTDVIQLWEDYAFMLSIDTMPRWTESPPVEHIISPSPELFRILVTLGLLRYHLSKLRPKLDLTWTDLRDTLCSLRPKVVAPEHTPPIHRPQAAYSWVARDLALHFIRKIVNNYVDTEGGVNPSGSRDVMLLYNQHCSPYGYYPFIRNIEEAYTRSQDRLVWDIAYLVRLSPPCPLLHRELWRIPPSEIWSSRPSGNVLIHHVFKWLEFFPDSTMELITFWEQAAPDPEPCHDSTFNFDPDVQERYWRDLVGRHNNTIGRLHLPDSFKIDL
ncbi:AAA-16 domain-containing protein [Mycena sanguinolenta]|uniref:AAA-16 domain-containing protein n=1 Tax=Mycena sanguinolenta TaxID=230812 RepID=A0A8H7DEY5_9AGAR|nr:AAA-16 domain-containing protein [Mycena sanguinolenta]